MRCAFGGRLQAGQALAHDHRQRLLDRRVRAGGDIGIAGALVAIVEHGVEIGGDALHAARADRLDARLLDGVEGRAGARDLRRQAPMHLDVVAGEPQRHRIGVAAQDRGIARVEPARRIGQPRFGARPGLDQARALGRIDDFKAGAFGERAQASGDRAFERLLRAFHFRRRFCVRACQGASILS